MNSLHCAEGAGVVSLGRGMVAGAVAAGRVVAVASGAEVVAGGGTVSVSLGAGVQVTVGGGVDEGLVPVAEGRAVVVVGASVAVGAVAWGLGDGPQPASRPAHSSRNSLARAVLCLSALPIRVMAWSPKASSTMREVRAFSTRARSWFTLSTLSPEDGLSLPRARGEDKEPPRPSSWFLQGERVAWSSR